MLLDVNDLTKIYGKTIALDGLCLHLRKGRIIGLLGPNGSGKTTLLKTVAGLLQPTSGEVTVNGIPVGEKTKSLVSFLPERTYLALNMKVCETLSFFEDFYSDFDRNRAEKMLSVLGVGADRRFGELSKGTREKVQLVLVMSRRAELYLLDEPIGGVDPATREFIMNTVLKNFNENSSIVISTHLIRDVEEILDDYAFIANGRILEFGSVKERKEETGLTLDELFREEFRCY